MLAIGDPFSKIDIAQSLQTVNTTIADYFAGLSPEQFFAHPPEVWSPAENLQHLIQSVSPIVRALGTPLEVLNRRFGTADHPSRRYVEIRELYLKELAKGVVAFGIFLPVIEAQPNDPQAAQAQIVPNWREVGQQIIEAMNGWGETELDTYQLPHPVLGSLTMREMLLFTLYHNQHHLNDARRLVEAAT